MALAFLLAGLTPVAARAVGQSTPSACRAWPGEPDPLPRAEGKSLAARWARLRAAELSRLARRLEKSDPVTAHALFAHAACLAPGDDTLRSAEARTVPLRWHRPGLASGAAPLPRAPAASIAGALAELDEPIAILPPAPEQEDVDVLIALARQRVDAAQRLLQQARFEDALAELDRAHRGLAAAPDGSRVNALRAEIDVLSATANVALGRADAARASFARALAARPDLKLDPRTTSPKVFALFQEMRSARTAPGAQP